MKKQRSGAFVWGGISLLAGLPFFAAGLSAGLLLKKPITGLVAVALILFAVWYLTGFTGAALTAVCSVTAALSARAGGTLLRGILLSCGLTLAAGVLLSLWLPGLMSTDPSELEPLRDFYLSAGMEQSMIDRVFHLISYFYPGMGAAQIILGSLAAVLFFSWTCRTGAFSEANAASSFRIHWSLAWIPILCLGIIALSRSSQISPWLLRAAANALVAVSVPYFLLGLIVALRWARAIPGMLFLLILSALFALPLVMGVILVTGILDTWLDFRKKIENRLERKNNEGSSD